MVINSKRFIYVATLDRVCQKLEKLISINNDEEINMCILKLNEIKNLVGEIGIFDYDDNLAMELFIEQTKELIKLENIIDKFIKYFDACEKKKYLSDKLLLDKNLVDLEKYVKMSIELLDSMKRVSSNNIDEFTKTLDDMYKFIYLLMKLEFIAYGRSTLFLGFENNDEDRYMINKWIISDINDCINSSLDDGIIEIAKKIRLIEDREDFYDKKVITFLASVMDDFGLDKVINEYNDLIKEISEYNLEIDGRWEDCICEIQDEVGKSKGKIKKLKLELFRSCLAAFLSICLGSTTIIGGGLLFRKVSTVKKYNSTKSCYNTVDKEYKTIFSEYTEYNIGDVIVTEIRPEKDCFREYRAYLIPQESYLSDFGSFEEISEKIYMLDDYELIDIGKVDSSSLFLSNEYYLLMEEIKNIDINDMTEEFNTNLGITLLTLLSMFVCGTSVGILSLVIFEKIKLSPRLYYQIKKELDEEKNELKKMMEYLDINMSKLEDDKRLLKMAQSRLDKLCDLYQYVIELLKEQGKVRTLSK